MNTVRAVATTSALSGSRVRKGRKGKFPIFESEIREVAGGRFEIDAFSTDRNGECERIC
jgi:hypothetical protein